MFWKIVSYNFDVQHLVIGLFFTILLYDVLNIGYHFKRLFKISFTKSVKPFDCLSCMSFWTTLLSTQSVLTSMTAFVIIYLIDYAANSSK